MNNILVLGAGLVTKPMIEYFNNQRLISVTLADLDLSKAKAISERYQSCNAVELDVNNDELLDNLIKKCDLVVSLLPYTFHVKIAELAIKHHKNMVTASYVSEEMKKLNDEAKEKGVTILNEIGLDPGIDHMSAMKIIDSAKENGGKVTSFKSCCGGLPAPENNDNPFGYKFSWSPRGVVMAGRNSARYLLDGEIVNIEGTDLFNHHWNKKVNELGNLEIYPNRDSLSYKSIYGLDDAETVFRGTFRYPGWCDTLKTISELGFLDEQENKELAGSTYAKLMSDLLNLSDTDNLEESFLKKFNLDTKSKSYKSLKWLGLFEENLISSERLTKLDILADLMIKKMSYRPDEKDMVVLEHEFIVEYEDRKEYVNSLLIDFGIPGGDSSMSRTVSLPAAVAAKNIVYGNWENPGVQIPVQKDLYIPVLSELEELGIVITEKSEIL